MLMTKHDSTTEALGDLVAAFGLLTRLPLPQRAVTATPRAAWAWPLVGAVVGGLSAAAGALALWLGLPLGVAAAVALATSAMVTGGLHEDGLADTADGLFGGWTRERRLEIMKDSRIGSYGMLALLLVTLARWSAVTALMATDAHWAGLVAAGALSRVPMAVLMAALPNARGTGLAHAVGAPPHTAILAALALACAIGVMTTGSAVLGMIALATATTLALGLLARAKIGGQTGDILGASQQLADLAVLSVAAAALT
jgi:adenosylcobinamide-GDP ribazoletransferase